MEMREQSLEQQDQTLNAEQTNVQNVSEENAETVEATVEQPQTEVAHPQKSKESLLESLLALAEKPANEVSRDEVGYIKQQFSAIRKVELEAEKAAFVEKGNEASAFAPVADEVEEKFKETLNIIKEKKAALLAEQEAERQKNFDRKSQIIVEIKALAADTDNVNKTYPQFKELQQEFKTVGEVPATEVTNLWKQYQEAVESFYDQLKVNKELRDYDFKKNLDTKQLLCEEAEKLAQEGDVVVAFKRLQDLHDKWREVGPVAKEIREEIWTRFKDASAVVNKKYQAFFEERKAREQENETAKTALCERVEAIEIDSINSFNAWNDATKVILQAQDDWRKLGFASKKANNQLFARFRAVCDKFFAQKAEYYKTVKDEMAANLEKKISLCEQAEALKDSTDWKATADKLTDLQHKWKTIGAVPKKRSDEVWKRFQEACDYFFEQKKQDLSQSRKAEQENLRAKRALTASLKEIDAKASRQEVVAAIKNAQARWNEIGHVPFRDKDKVYEEFRAVINELYKTHDLKDTRANFARFENSINEMSDSGKLARERERLARVLETKRSELTTYQNNLGFFNFKSTSGSSMLRDIERKTQRIRDDIADLEKKIALIDDRL